MGTEQRRTEWHRSHRRQVIRDTGAETVLRRGPADGTSEALAAARAEVERLTDLTRLLGPARRVLDRCAEDASSDARAEAAVMAQRIVDWIGHSVTDEPARAADLAGEVERLRGLLREVTAALRDVRSAAHDGLDAGQIGADLARMADHLDATMEADRG
jgi:hypothetical protein